MSRTQERVLLLGWAGSRPEQLGAMRRLYARRRAEVRVVVPEAAKNLAFPSGWARQGRGAAEWLAEGDRPGVVHLFSNGGFFLWDGILQHVGSASRIVRAVVMDSAPGYDPTIAPGLVAHHGAMAMMPSVLHLLRRPPRLTHPLLSPALESTFRGWISLMGPLDGMFDAYRRVLTAAGTVPHLFFYGGQDVLVYPRFVEGFMSRLEAQGTPVAARFFPEGEHVRLLLGRRREYAAELEAFLDASP